MISRAGNSSMYKITLRAKFYCEAGRMWPAGREFDTYDIGQYGSFAPENWRRRFLPDANFLRLSNLAHHTSFPVNHKIIEQLIT